MSKLLPNSRDLAVADFYNSFWNTYGSPVWANPSQNQISIRTLSTEILERIIRDDESKHHHGRTLGISRDAAFDARLSRGPIYYDGMPSDIQRKMDCGSGYFHGGDARLYSPNILAAKEWEHSTTLGFLTDRKVVETYAKMVTAAVFLAIPSAIILKTFYAAVIK